MSNSNLEPSPIIREGVETLHWAPKFIINKYGGEKVHPLVRGQESRIIASVSGDPAMIELYEHGCGDRVYVTLYGNI